ncbi:MAG: HAMP domain-containing histidine kinase [Cyclobacteriaceae bacterium]|nr:HAMP domain-containing histidine kinase [Cyclobacteriaceae bacterium]
MRVRPLYLFLLADIILASGIFLRSRYSDQFPSSLAGQVANNIEAEYRKIETEVLSLLPDSVTMRSSAWDRADHFFLRTDSSGIIAWNQNQYIPEPSTWKGPDTLTFLSNQRGDFLIRKWPCTAGNVVNVLTLRSRYPIANGFLTPRLNPDIFPVRDLNVVAANESAGDEVRLNGITLFRVVAGPAEAHDSSWSFAILIAGLGLLLYSIHRISRGLREWLGPEVTLVGLLASLYAVRWGMVKAGIPALFFQSDIFDPRVFASSELNASMGDLFFNGLCVFILVLYLVRHFSGMRSIRWLLQQHQVIRFVSGSFFLLLALLGLLLSYNFIEVIYHNSSQSLDITQSISFSIVRLTAFLSVLIGTISAFLFIHITVSIARHLLFDRRDVFALALALAAGLFMWQYELTGNNNVISLITGLVMLSLIRLLNFDRLEFSFSFPLFLYLVFSLTLFSIHHSIAVRGFHMERLGRDQLRYAKDFLTERDVLGEYLLDQARQRIAADPFVQTRMASPFFSRNSVVERVRRVHVNRYFDRYEVVITTRSTADSNFADSPDAGKFRPTGYASIWYSANAAGDALKRYHVSIPIVYQRLVGYVEIDLVLKRLLPDNVFPELLVDNRFSQLYRNRDFSYAIFQDGKLTNSFGAFNYERDFQQSQLSNQSLFAGGLTLGSFEHQGIDNGDGMVAVVSAPSYGVSAVITNVSFWFVLGLTFLFTVQGVFGAWALAAGRQFAFTARIQLYLFLAFVLPMVAVSVTTLTLMARTNEEGTTKEFLDRSTHAASRLSAFLSEAADPGSGRLETWAVENSQYVETDISVYSPAGTLVATSQPSLFENQLLAEHMNREAFRKIVLQGERQAVTNEQIGSLQFNSAYAAVLSPQTGKLEAILSLPFFESATYVQREQFLVVSTILQVFLLAFLVFTVLSFMAADRLAFPFRLMARTLRHTTLAGQNQPLTWKASDEIGMLVGEYNRMVSNLEDSKQALARSEKESAWREMAKQVAHEIKNPLTPMKLTLQQLEKGLREGTVDASKIRKSLDVLLQQVEILNAIASSFSGFARMPAPSPERAEVGKLVAEAVSLFASGEQGQLNYVPAADPLWISIDPKSFNRAISNILINAFQAKSPDRELIVTLSTSREGNQAKVEIRDNGRGIPDEVRERIFQPQFTTKESGSGLGLYMARQFVVQAGGKIWFESVKGQGTAFFLEFPLLEEGSAT